MVSNLIVIIGAGIVGWFLAGEPTNFKDLKKGIGKLVGDTGFGGPDYGGYPPYGMYPPPVGQQPNQPPPSSDPAVQALQQQMQAQQMQAQMDKQQQAFSEQLTSQQQAAQLAQLQQQMQAQASSLGGGGASSGVPMGQNTGAANPLTSSATALPAQADAAQQMLPSTTAPGIVPGMQQQPMPEGQGQSPYNPYGGITSGIGNVPGAYPGLDPSSVYGGYGVNPSAYTGMSAATDPTGIAAAGGFGFGGLSPVNQMFAGHYDPMARPVGIQPPLAAVPNFGPNIRPPGRIHHGFLGIIDHDTIEHGRPTPFFSGYPELMRIDLGSIFPGLGGATVGDLIVFTDSGTGNEIFINGIDRFDHGAFVADIVRYINRITRNMAGYSPADRIEILRELLIEAGRTRGLSFFNPIPPNVVTYQNVLSTVPRRHFPDMHPIHRGTRRDGRITLPDKYAVLQGKGSNSMPPMVNPGTEAVPKKGKSMFF